MGGIKERFPFENSFRIPQEDYSDYSSFKFFFDTLRSSECDGKISSGIGMILGKNIKGADGHFPHESVRRLLEEYDSRELDEDIAAFFEDLHEMRIVGDGKPLRELAKGIKKFANELQIDYPHTTHVLKLISKEYDKMANRDYVQSEVMNY